MKYWYLVICGILSGCGSLDSEMIPGNMLDVAPRSNEQLRHPEWGYSTIPYVSAKQHVTAVKYDEKKPQGVTSLEMYLDRNQIAHEVLAGENVMIRLKEKINFQFDSSRLSANSQNWIQNLGQYLSSRPDVDVVIDGHADSSGAESYNEGLSERRAKEVESQLLTMIPRQRLFSRGFGELVPKCSNNSSIGKACNRRVELMLIVNQ
ncbi:OmpA family protein [Vibrio rotiferianus]|uniref:OmpA family protein n=1 Tax=Vibrio rotiferianus TaxID=190895 RepID=A0A7Y3ZCB1_9VIBR|nr:OmpA family protein [Vibrio rotiferianus]NOH50459.1 OmpA family protein [Vibrio rotiferianus]